MTRLSLAGLIALGLLCLPSSGQAGGGSSGALTLLQEWRGLGHAPLAVSPDGRWLALTRPAPRRPFYAPYDTRIEVRETATLRRLYRVPAANGDGKTLLFSPDSHTLWSAHSGTLHYGAWTGGLQDNREGSDGAGVSALAFAPDGQSYALAGVNAAGQTRLGRLAVEQWRPLWPNTPPSVGDGEPPNWIHSLAFSPDGRWLASGSGGGGVILRDAASGKRVRLLSDPQEAATQAGRRGWTAHPGAVTALRFLSPTRLLTGSRDGVLKLWDVPGGRVLSRLRLPGRLSDLELAPDGRVLTATSTGLVLIGGAREGLSVRETLPQPDPVTDLAVTARAQVWAVTREGTLQRWALFP